MARDSNFSFEYKRAVVAALTAAFAFVMAMAWSEVISEHVDKVVALSPLRGKIVSALLITVVSLFGMFAVAWLSRDLASR